MLADDLLLWLSARERGSWYQFRNAVNRLRDKPEEIIDEKEETAPERQEPDSASMLSPHTLLHLNLSMLGHVEFYHEADRYVWRVVPPFLGITRSKEEMLAVLCGARWPGFVEDIMKSATEFAGISIERCPLDDAPEALRISFKKRESIIEFAQRNRVSVQEKAALTLLTSIPSLKYPMLLKPNSLPYGEGWSVEHFDTGALKWVPLPAGGQNQPPQGLNRYSAKYASRRYFLIKRNRRSHNIASYELSPRIGKYLILRSKKRSVVRYNSETSSIVLPAVCRPPLLIERALVLCSGLIPMLDRNRYELIYKDVPAEVARIACKLLEQEVF